MNAVKSRGASVDSAPRNSRRITPSALIHEVNQQGVRAGTTGFSPWGSIIAQNPVEFAGLKRARLKSIWGVKVRIVTAEDLLVHKLLSERPRDLEDARGIIVRRGKRLDKEYVMCWLGKMDKLSPDLYLIKKYKKLIS